MILLVSDLDLGGSGYCNIAVSLAKELTDRGRKVTVLGIAYKGDEHGWPFSIIPVVMHEAWNHLPAMIQNLMAMAQAGRVDPIEAIVVALDIPHHERGFYLPRGAPGTYQAPYVGIFPIESGPLCPTWANYLARLESRLVISQFGLDQMRDAGLAGVYLPVGIDATAWRMPEPEERRTLREAMMLEDDETVVLTVADNQERKNLSATAKAIQAARKKGLKVRWLLVTRVYSPVGWKLPDLTAEHEITDVTMTFERGLPHDRLWVLYACADVFLLMSKAEGLCMPIVEAMATGLPVAATDCTAVTEHLYAPDGTRRGFPVAVEYLHQDPWGNSYRHYASPESAAVTLCQIAEMRGTPELAEIIARARAYAVGRTWEQTGDILDRELTRVIRSARIPSVSGFVPSTMPQIVPSKLPLEGAPNEQETPPPKPPGW